MFAHCPPWWWMCEWELVGLRQLVGFVKVEDHTHALKYVETFEGWASEEPDVPGAEFLVANCG